MTYFVFQIYIDGVPQHKHFKHCATGSGRMLGVKKGFKKYAEKHGFDTFVDDQSSWFGYSFQDSDNRIMSLRFTGEDEV